MIEAILIFALALGLGWPIGRYLAAVMRGAPMRGDRVFGVIERPLYRLIGTNPSIGMSADAVQALVDANTEGRQFGVLGAPRVNVLRLNLALDAARR